MKLKIDEENGFAKFEGTQALGVLYPAPRLVGAAVKFGDTVAFDLDSYEEIVAELRPGLVNPTPQARRAELSFSPALVRGDGGATKLSATVEVLPAFSQVRLAVLLEPDREVKDLKADAVDAGKPLTLSVENGGHGVWYWYWVDLAPGAHFVAVTIHQQVPGRISAWLVTERGLGRTNTILGTQPDIERRTHLLLEETIR